MEAPLCPNYIPPLKALGWGPLGSFTMAGMRYPIYSILDAFVGGWLTGVAICAFCMLTLALHVQREGERARDPNYFAVKNYLFFPDMQCTRTRALSLSHCSAKSSKSELKLSSKVTENILCYN